MNYPLQSGFRLMSLRKLLFSRSGEVRRAEHLQPHQNAETHRHRQPDDQWNTPRLFSSSQTGVGWGIVNVKGDNFMLLNMQTKLLVKGEHIVNVIRWADDEPHPTQKNSFIATCTMQRRKLRWINSKLSRISIVPSINTALGADKWTICYVIIVCSIKKDYLVVQS